MTPTTLASLAETYDGFLIDQFGVLLDGAAAYPGAPEALAALAERNKPVVILSNSGRRAAPNADRLVRMGFARDSFDAVVSSGEAAYAAIAGRIGTDIEPGAPVLVLSRGGDLSGIEGLDLIVTDDPAKAALILLAGSRGDEWPLEHYATLFAGPSRRRVPCLCTNPDMTMLTANGAAYGAGMIARLYRDLGGPVEYFGKPYPLIYQAARAHFGTIGPGRILCIGDSPEHDVRGGRDAGHATALVMTGIHAGTPLEDLILHAAEADAVPDHVIPGFAI